MFNNTELRNHLNTSSVINSNSAIIAEWNMNYSNNIDMVGNYRYRPNQSGSEYSTIVNTFDPQDAGNFYTGATDADTVIDGGYDDEGIPTVFQSPKQKENLLYSLEDCFGRFRPRSGINKARYFEYNKYFHHSNSELARRPRYYPGHKDDTFKYWTSYRTEAGIERGIANRIVNSQYYIDDASPFVVYREAVPANRVVVKMQTHVGDIDLGPFSTSSGSIDDPMYGTQNQCTPINWKIQGLDSNNSWYDLASFTASSLRKNGSPIIGPDGYVEIQYGLTVPEGYEGAFTLISELSSASLLPAFALYGQSYLVKETVGHPGKIYVWNGIDYDSFTPDYSWKILDAEVDRSTSFVTALNAPEPFVEQGSGRSKYREFEYLKGLRVVVQTMNKPDSTFDLIELSPRLSVDVSGYTKEFTITKSASDIGVSGMPVDQLLASTGSIVLFDYDNSFNPINSSSIISKYLAKNIQFKFYEIILDVDNYDYYVPLKSLYSDGFPAIDPMTRNVSMDLRDLFFYFESMTAPQIFVSDVSFSYAVSLLLDSIGFSNYTFRRTASDIDPVIPAFFIGPDTNVSKVLESLAVSAQCTMFFDEYNNFVLMNKGYLMPSEEERATDLVLYGSKDYQDSGIVRNATTNQNLANIIELSSQNSSVYNSGTISYTSRYIQKDLSSLKQAGLLNNEQSWVYKQAMLWEVSGDKYRQSINNESGNQPSFILAAIPLNSDLSDAVPTVVNNQVINNVIDLGEAVYFMSRYEGYLYSSGEVIKYDAIQYSVAGINGDSNVWISSVQEFQNYFSKLKFNGKIYPTGLVRIYTEPFYEVVNNQTVMKNGPVRRHGRGQFGTSVVLHSAGINPYWTSDDTVKVSYVDSRHLFGKSGQELEPKEIPAVSPTKSTRNGIIKNFLSSSYTEDSTVESFSTLSPGTIQSSALIFNGPNYTVEQNPLDYVMLIPKPLTNKFNHFGTRMRIIGKIENADRAQTPLGATSYYVSSSNEPIKPTTISGGSGGIAVMLDANNRGYYFELIALSTDTIEAYADSDDIQNIIFYKIGDNGNVPTKLWGGIAGIVTDDGKFTGQARRFGESTTTVYDLAVEYIDVGATRRFFLYINSKLVAIVDDANPLPVYNNFAPFVRGSSRCMFENIYALGANYAQNTTFVLDTPASSAILDDEINFDESFNRYALSGVIQSSYLSGISPIEPPKYNIYYEEFGSIMREAAYFNIRYDKAYPALTASLSKTLDNLRGYAAAGFIAGSYGAEFIIFNSTDTLLALDETSGNYLKIQGVTFTQESVETISVDDYFRRRSDFSKPVTSDSGEISSPIKAKADYFDIKASRSTYGINEFSLSPDYIQSQDAATEMMGWIISKVMKPRKSVGVTLFPDPTIQLGDIVSIVYSDESGNNQISVDGDRFVVYSIEYRKSVQGPVMNLYLSEVI